MTSPTRERRMHAYRADARPEAPPDRGFRLDIQGLRAVAVVLVLAYHLWPETVTGGFVGVDVFFVISGFLITAHLVAHPPTRSRHLLEFWGRRIRRLLPAAFLVLIVTAIASRLIAPDTRWAANAGEIIASALYVQNWALSARAVDYLGAAEAPTPVQHYWSLSVEEQFYLFWPILILGVFWLARRSRLGPLLVTRLAMLAVVGGSLYYSITATATDPLSAYFITPTRVWELATGGLVATLPSLAGLRLPDRVVSGAAWLGIGMLLLAGFVFTSVTPFPGSAALLPVVGTALVILAAAEGRASPTRLLGVRPVQHLGDTSYSIYLWHWPLIALWPYAFGALTLGGSLLIVVVTIGLATITKTLVEDGFRFSPSFQPLVPTFRFAVVGMVLLSVLGGSQLFEAQRRLDAALASVGNPLDGFDDAESTGPPGPEATLEPGATLDPGSTAQPTDPLAGLTSCVGAAAIVRGFDACPQDPAGAMKPDPLVAATDRSAAYRDGCWNYAPFATHKTCQYGHGAIKVALVGNSHAGHWLPTLQVLAKLHGWTITTFLASQCNATDAALEFYSASKTAGCLAYGDWVISATSGTAFDLVVTSERQSVPLENLSWSDSTAPAFAGYASYLKRWSDAGTRVLVLQDTPYPGKTLASVPDCLAQHPTTQTACSGTPDTWHWVDPLWTAASGQTLLGISTVATTRFFCTDTVCPGVIGGLVTYFDASHMTATYARTVAPFIDAEVLAALASPR
ncbi:MAG TPA: acyltransferase family protein [Candidatus Acidoferrales bacterium]|nr:acyltransferase family protein [Candidatus Acidoferrales bacterium]